MESNKSYIPSELNGSYQRESNNWEQGFKERFLIDEGVETHIDLVDIHANAAFNFISQEIEKAKMDGKQEGFDIGLAHAWEKIPEDVQTRVIEEINKQTSDQTIKIIRQEERQRILKLIEEWLQICDIPYEPESLKEKLK